jgi:glutamyl-tRNA reductase
MTIFLIGLNHHTAPVEVREQVALTGDGLRLALKELQAGERPPIEGVILSTCNRLEIYALADPDGPQVIDNFLTRMYGIDPADLRPHLYTKSDRAAINHLMRVAAGLESMILGEPQILGQVTQAHVKARSTGAAGPILLRLFTQAVHAGKRAHTETDISRYTTSVSHAAVLLAKEKLGDLVGVKALIIGAGEIAEQAAHALHAHGTASITCISRTYSHAEALASQVGGRAFNWVYLPEGLSEADVVISATGAPHSVIHVSNVVHVLPEREGRPLLLIDIAVPRDVDQEVGELPGVDLHDIDDLQAVLDDNLAQRQAAIPQVEAIVNEEVTAFEDWLRCQEVVPTIVELRQKAEEMAQAEVERTLRRLDGLSDDEQAAINQLASRIVNKLLHEPTTRLKAQATNGNRLVYSHTVRDLFGLDEDAYDG